MYSVVVCAGAPVWVWVCVCVGWWGAGAGGGGCMLRMNSPSRQDFVPNKYIICYCHKKLMICCRCSSTLPRIKRIYWTMKLKMCPRTSESILTVQVILIITVLSYDCLCFFHLSSVTQVIIVITFDYCHCLNISYSVLPFSVNVYNL